VARASAAAQVLEEAAVQAGIERGFSWRRVEHRRILCMIPAMRALFSARAASVLQRAGRVMIPAVLLGLLAFASGCTAVAPYERGKLAHPTMSAGSLSTMGEEHLRAISEGATGGSGGTGSGCGCN